METLCDRTLLNALPIAIFVVDGDVRIRDLNAAATSAFGLNKPAVLDRRGGEVLRCLHAHDVPEGCGRGPYCRGCIIRDSVTTCLAGQTIARRRTKAELLLGETRKEVDLLITASPIPGGEEPLALLAIEDISEISTLRSIIPICANCKKVRDDREYWRTVESYFQSYIGVGFSHGMCPECMTKLYPEYGGPGSDRQK
jgi:hypothetical protein